MNDISNYIDFSKDDGEYKKTSLKSFLDKSIIVHNWKKLESKYKDGNPSGEYVRMVVEYEGEKSLVNTGSSIIIGQLDKIMEAKENNGETDLCFTCVLKKFGNGVKFYPNNFEVKQ